MVEQCLQSSEAFPAPHTALPARRLGVGRKPGVQTPFRTGCAYRIDVQKGLVILLFWVHALDVLYELGIRLVKMWS